jgi:hypothetical protein
MAVPLHERIKKWLSENAPGSPCVGCGSQVRVIDELNPVALLPAPKDSVCAVVVVICHGCGHIELWSASRMGIQPSDLPT